MADRETNARPSRGSQLLDEICDYAARHGLAALSLRPMAQAVGSSTGVLRFLFGSKDDLVDRVLDRLLTRERRMLGLDEEGGREIGLEALWRRVSSPENREHGLLAVEAQALSLRRTGGEGYAERHVRAWRAAVFRAAPDAGRDADSAQPTLIAATLRGALTELLATGDTTRVNLAVQDYIRATTGRRGPA